MYTHMCVYMYMYIYKHMYIYVRAHTHMYMCVKSCETTGLGEKGALEPSDYLLGG